MGATEEQMELLHNAGIDHVSYVLILYSVAFLLYLCKSIICAAPLLSSGASTDQFFLQSSIFSSTSTPVMPGQNLRRPMP